MNSNLAPECWEITGDILPSRFLTHLDLVLDEKSVIAFEIHETNKKASEIYAKFPPPLLIEKWHDVIFPESVVCHVGWNAELKKTILATLNDQSTYEWFIHIKVYRNERLWIWYHDADSQGFPVISPRMEQALVKSFANAIGGIVSRIKTESKYWNTTRLIS